VKVGRVLLYGAAGLAAALLGVALLKKWQARGARGVSGIVGASGKPFTDVALPPGTIVD